MTMRRNLDEEYSPLYFLASLGSGGLAVTFFMFLMFMTPHEGHPIPVFEDVRASLLEGSVWMQAVTVLSLLGIVWFALQHLRLLFWNLREQRRFQRTASFDQLRRSDAEVQLMAMPLTCAMAVNVLFIVGAVFVPGLWGIAEYLFPGAMLAFLLIGWWAGRIFRIFFTRVLAYGHFDCEKNNSLSQMLSIFTFAMVGVGLSASAAMSHSQVTSALGIIFATLFVGVVLTLGVIKIVLGFRSMLEHGINYEASVSLWIVIPILTILAITINRIAMGLQHNFGIHVDPWFHVIVFTMLIAVQILFGVLGHSIMRELGYFREFIRGSGKSVVAYAAICPGVAFFVLGNFLVNKGLVASGVVTKFSVLYFALYVPLVAVQLQSVLVLQRLNAKLLRG